MCTDECHHPVVHSRLPLSSREGGSHTEVIAPIEGEGVASGGEEAGGDGEFVPSIPIGGLLEATVLVVFGCAASEDDPGDAVGKGEAPCPLDVT